ncbi:disulfide oxidoreductase [Bacillus cereus]|uniref:disulfide oxidoreductase n=1 Tax=Bacillus cereus TaxID=1396 RepID=UPI000BFA5D0E|nr:disulfide oxidoreductase [Bacillus cereus]PET56980.1 disulfide bond formation protein B [Bacillus cereus]PFB26332.1 disulfide bond formation protein B [Bacillus cereus]PFK78465.1 disulfide bond formation protein B [Bacillus cereus]PFL81572.1 disulfide bond formation protein B [Bacillus cereus]PGV04142.1 disulfide bond formation protein B [Bacillus cereus]
MKPNKQIENALFLTWIISLIATLGSLFFSEILHYEPCKLCWFQRIFMYPLVFITTISLIKKDFKQSLYILILSTIGGSISIYHYLIQKTELFSTNNNFCGRIPCSGEYINLLGFITIPFLALIAFTLIFILNFWILHKQKKVK